MSFSKLKFNMKCCKKKQFTNIMNFAENIIQKNRSLEESNETNTYNHPIFNLIRLLGKGTQYKLMAELIVNGKEPKMDKTLIFFDFFDERIEDSVKGFSLIKKVNFDKKIELKKEVILPWPWNIERLSNSMCNFGSELFCKDWKEDPTNHFIELWLPFGISWVNGGNHSITTGILQGEGSITPTAYDISDYYDRVYCDGEYYRLRSNNSKLSKVYNVEFAAIYEIGRIIRSERIIFNPKNVP